MKEHWKLGRRTRTTPVSFFCIVPNHCWPTLALKDCFIKVAEQATAQTHARMMFRCIVKGNDMRCSKPKIQAY